MRIAYISGPYRADTIAGIRRNIENAARVAERWWTEPDIDFVMCPHTNTGFMDGAATDDVFLRGDLAFIRECMDGTGGDVMVMLPGWRESEGATAERALALSMDIEVVEGGP